MISHHISLCFIPSPLNAIYVFIIFPFSSSSFSSSPMSNEVQDYALRETHKFKCTQHQLKQAHPLHSMKHSMKHSLKAIWYIWAFAELNSHDIPLELTWYMGTMNLNRSVNPMNCWAQMGMSMGTMIQWESRSYRFPWYPLVNVYITMENHHFVAGKIHYKWSFSIAILT
jgi:hypothetical protein